MPQVEDKDARRVLDELFESSFGFTGNTELVVTLKQIVRGEDSIVVPEELLGEDLEDAEEGSIFNLIKEMSVPQKIKLALFGNKIARSILLRDSLRQIPLFVLQNNRITESEILEIAANVNIDEQVLRSVANNGSWMKSYAMKLAIVSNPKVPVDVSLRWLKFLVVKDLRKLARSKNVPSVVSSQCRRILDRKAS